MSNELCKYGEALSITQTKQLEEDGGADKAATAE